MKSRIATTLWFLISCALPATQVSAKGCWGRPIIPAFCSLNGSCNKVNKSMGRPDLVRGANNIIPQMSKTDQPTILSKSIPKTKQREDQSINDLYRSVAKHDTEWFEKFVVGPLGQDVVGEIMQSQQQQTKPETQDDSYEKQSIKRDEPMVPGQTIEEIKSITQSSFVATSPIEIQKFSASELSTSSSSCNTSEKIVSLVDNEESVAPNITITKFEKGKVNTKNTSATSNISINESANDFKIVELSESNVTNAGFDEKVVDNEKTTFGTSNASINETTIEMEDARNTSILDTTSVSVTSSEDEKELLSNSSTIEVSNEVVVLYRDLYNREALRCVPLANLTKLGYSEGEIQLLQPDVVTLIVEDSIYKPRAGIPPRWKISSVKDKSEGSKKNEDVWILTRSEANKLMDEKKNEEQDTTTTAKSQQQSAFTDDVDRRGIPRSTRKRRGEERRRPRPRPRRRPYREQSRERQNFNEDGTRKRIYNVHGTVSKPREIVSDPPPPQSPLWVDIDTFRDLLRNEAELRVRILGEDWTDIIKDESDWRLDLYKKWLWTLHNGVGSPIVPSRSDRMRASLDRERRGDPRSARRRPRRRKQYPDEGPDRR